MTPEIVPGMAEKIEARRIELDLSLKDFVTDSGLTRQGLAPYRKGERRNYNDAAKRSVARALRWRHDAIDRLLLGQDPIPLEDEYLETLAASRRTTEAVTRHVQADLVFGLSDGTQIYVEVKGGGKVREAEVITAIAELFEESDLALSTHGEGGRISALDKLRVATRAARAAADRRARLSEVSESERAQTIAEAIDAADALEALVAASRADANEQSVERRRRPGADAPIEQSS